VWPGSLRPARWLAHYRPAAWDPKAAGAAWSRVGRRVAWEESGGQHRIRADRLRLLPRVGPRVQSGPLLLRGRPKVFDGMLLRVTAAGHDLAGGEIPLRLASGLLTVAPRAPLGLLARRVTHQGATAVATWSAPARARRRRRGGGVGAGTPFWSRGARRAREGERWGARALRGDRHGLGPARSGHRRCGGA
jgi:hypothetical protein